MPWERQSGESPRAFAAFCIYRDLGPANRSLQNVSRQLQKSYSLIGRWSRGWRWGGRSMAWDAENERVKRNEHLTSVTSMAVRQALTGQLLQSKAVQRFRSMTDEDVSRLSPWEALRMAEVGFRLERTARGQPDLDVPIPGVSADAALDAGPTITLTDIMRAHPERTGPIVEALIRLRELVPEFGAGSPLERDDDSVAEDDDRSG